MNIIKSVLIKPLILSLIQLLLLLSLATLSFSTYLETVQKQKATVIKQFVTNHPGNDGKSLARQLRQGFAFESFNIQQLDGTSVYQSVTPTTPSAFSYDFFNALDLLPVSEQVVNETFNIQLQFDVNLNDELAFFDSIALLIVSLSLLFMIFTLWSLRQGLTRTLVNVSQNIVTQMEQFTACQDNKQDFSWQAIPDSFGRVIDAVELMTLDYEQKINAFKHTAQQISDEAFIDELTGLPNRHRFVQYFEENLGDSDKKQGKTGSLAIIRCTELSTINRTLGYQKGDKYITDVVTIIKTCLHSIKDHQIYRINGGDFACILPNNAQKRAAELAQELQNQFNQYQRLNEIDSVAYTGIIQYQPDRPLGEILALTDTAISIAQTKQSNGWHCQTESDQIDTIGSAYGNQHWRQVIEDVIDNNRVALMYQVIRPSKSSIKTYSEILTRFKTSEEQILPTTSFLAMAEKLDKIIQVDRMIIETTLEQINLQNLTDQYFGINITPRTAHDDQFVNWLERRLLKEPQIASKLIFEVSEVGLQQNIKSSKRFMDMVHRTGGRITVERFGIGLTSFKFFRDLKPDFVKMDGSYTRNIDEDKNNQYFMRLMVDLTHRIGIGVFAEGVETQEEKYTLEKLFIDGTQGYYIGGPITLHQ